MKMPTDTCRCSECKYMKMNTLQKVRDCMAKLSPRIELPPHIIERARLPIERMLEISGIDLDAEPGIGAGASPRFEELTQFRRLGSELFRREILEQDFSICRFDGIKRSFGARLDGDGAIALFDVANDGEICRRLAFFCRGLDMRRIGR